ncbi:hypothetical protein BD311DRAFT_749092 [Dichomitus squalens]|uniref:Uncharacterized protein n=1 Tax=Dichomitus squalens TaxID=114155 RepID=A0A4Q9MZX1_9APHY|nr:hypothetical protein BD311DRAFT_749092 [Dichomitus squalens]
MYALPNRRGGHRKRLSALRLSSDSTVTTLPVYTSPPSHRQSDLPEIPSEQPPAYSDSAEEADEDTDPSEAESSTAYIPSPPPSIPVSPRRARRSQGSSRSSHRRQKSIASASDPFLDSLLERSVHALEMSNALLQSSMSTQTSLSAVLADDSEADRHLEERAQLLTSHIRGNRDQQRSWMDDLDEITRGVEGLVNGDSSDEEGSQIPPQSSISRSLPSSSGFSEHMRSRRSRRGSADFRGQHARASQSTTNLQLSVHERNDFVAPAPRAITMYVDSSEAADLIALPPTLGVRPASRAPPTPLINQTGFATPAPELELTPASAPARAGRPSSRAAEMLASYVMPRRSSFSSSSPPTSRTPRRSSSSSTSTAKRPRVSPPPPIRIDALSCGSSTALSSRSMSPVHGSPALRQHRPLTPPIEELSTSSASSESATLHVDRTVESLRDILKKQRSVSQALGKARSSSTHSAPPIPRPSLLSPPSVAPVFSTSTATASVSRLFTKGKHTTSRAQSPPKQSSMKKSSAPSTPVVPSPAMSSPSPSMLHVPDLFGLGRSRSAGSSGASTPKRISFIEPESYSSSKPEGSSSQFLATKTRSKSKSKSSLKDRDLTGKGKGKAKDGADGDGESAKMGWWTSWLLGAAGTESGSALGLGVDRVRSEERYAYGSSRASASPAVGTWSMRHGYGGSVEEWGV